MTSKATRVRIGDAGDSIRRREAFVAGDGSLTGAHETGADHGAGRAPASVRHLFDLAQDTTAARGVALFVVRSYGTPIGWAGPGEALTVPAVSYSVTTSRHQGIARRADHVDPTPETCPALRTMGTGGVVMRCTLPADHPRGDRIPYGHRYGF